MADVFNTVLDISLAASALALLAMAARPVIGRRPGAALPLLSALVILRLAVPVTIQSPLSVMNLFQGISIEQPAEEAPGGINEPAGYEIAQPTADTGVNASANTAENTAAGDHIQPEAAGTVTNAGGSYPAANKPAAVPPSAMDIASMIWIAGMAAMAACIAASNIRFTLALKKNRRYDTPGFSELLERCKEELGIKMRVEAVRLSGINTAAVYGILRPKLLISPSLGWLSEEEKRHVLLHELSHIKRRDTFVCLLIAALNVVYWFNPVVWIALALAKRDMEIMCDMAVLKLTRDRRAYASTLFSLASASNDPKPKLVSALFMSPQNALRFGVLISTDSIKRRMKMITRYKRSRLFTAVSILLVIAIAITGCTGAAGPASGGSGEILPEREGQKLIAAYVLDISSLPEDAARRANIEKAAGMIDGMVFPAADDTQTNPDLRYTWVDTDLGEITESSGWRIAPAIDREAIEQAEKWIMIYDPETSMHTNRDPEKFNSEILGSEMANKAGGGAELVMLAVCKAVSAANMDHYSDLSEGLGVGAMSNIYPEDLTLKVWVQDNNITAAIYAAAKTAGEFTLPYIEGQKLIAAYSLDFSSDADDEARNANIEKAAEMLDGTVFPHRDDSLTEAEDAERQIDIPDALGPITEEAGWKNAAWTGWRSAGVNIHENDETSGYFASPPIPAAETRMQAGGGIEVAAMAIYRVATLAGLDRTNGYDPAEDNVDNGGAGAVNNEYDSDLVLRMWVEDNCVIAAFYAEAAEQALAEGFKTPLLEIKGMEPIASFYLDYSSIADDVARVSNIEKAADAVREAAENAVCSISGSMEGYTVNYEIGPVTEGQGWKAAPWAAREALEGAELTCMESGPNGTAYVIGISSNIAEADSTMKVGGGIDLVFYAVSKAAALIGGRTADYSAAGEDDMVSCSVSFASPCYGLTLKVWAIDNTLIAAYYAPEGVWETWPMWDDEDNWRIKYADKFTDGEVEQTDNSYKSANINVTIEKVQKDDSTYFIADIYVADMEYFRTAFPVKANEMGGSESADRAAGEVGAILAINGDQCLINPGTVMRNGQIYRLPKSSSDVLVMYSGGNMRAFSPETFDTTSLKTQGAYQVWTCGPMLLKDGKPMTEFNLPQTVAERNSRTAVGYYEPGHYCFVVVDGKQPGYSEGLTLAQMSQLFAGLGCSAAYNMQGGDSSQMVFMGKPVNQPSNGGRNVSDIIYIGE